MHGVYPDNPRERIASETTAWQLQGVCPGIPAVHPEQGTGCLKAALGRDRSVDRCMRTAGEHNLQG